MALNKPTLGTEKNNRLTIEMARKACCMNNHQEKVQLLLCFGNGFNSFSKCNALFFFFKQSDANKWPLPVLSTIVKYMPQGDISRHVRRLCTQLKGIRAYRQWELAEGLKQVNCYGLVKTLR